jgi:hypothetical protein
MQEDDSGKRGVEKDNKKVSAWLSPSRVDSKQ